MSLKINPMEFPEADKVPAKTVSGFIHRAIHTTGAQERLLAQGIAMAESQFNRLASSKKGSVKIQTLKSLQRLAKLLEETEKTFSPSGAKRWLSAPNPYLHDVPPLLCLRSDKELTKVLSLLASIRYGFPA